MDQQHIIPPRTYFLVHLALLGLLVLTIGVAFVDLGFFNLILAISIAFSKAVLVVLYFMHVRYSDQVTKMYVGAGLLWLLILFGLTLSDYLTRTWAPPIGGPGS